MKLPVKMRVPMPGRDIEVLCQDKVAVKRWAYELSPEPETRAWIDGMAPGEIFFDIGANVGLFSLRAAVRGLRVFSFEPVYSNFSQLVENARRNNLNIHAFMLAMSCEAQIGVMARGRSDHTFNPCEIGPISVSSATLNYLCRELNVQPDHIKLDIDGDESKVLTGGSDIIKYAKSVLIEIDPGIEEHRDIVHRMKSIGFDYDLEQIKACMVKEGKYAGMANWIFRNTKVH